MKIAVPVEGESLKIVEKTGSAPFFAIFDGKTFEGLVPGKQKGAHGHHEHHEHHHDEDDQAHVHSHAKSLTGLAGVEIMFFRRVGEHMRQAVEQMGIKMKKSRERDGESAVDIVNAYIDKTDAVA